MNPDFEKQMLAGYTLNEPSVVLGRPMLDGEPTQAATIQVALSILNRHGLIAGATGTGKTKTLQLIAGCLSKVGVPVFVADIKGDVTGMAAPGDASNPKVADRMTSLGLPFTPSAHPVEFLSLSGKRGAQVRATVHSFGPLLLGKVLNLNDTQTSVLSLIFKYCDDNQLPLLDLKDLVATLKFLTSEEGKPSLQDYGGMSTATVNVLLRSIVVMEQEGTDIFFGEPEFNVLDLLRTAPDGTGVVSMLELSDVMEKPRLFSTFMLWMLAELYESLPEVGDLPKPKLCFFFDEAHLLFDDASQALLEQIERTARLIRSKGVGVYFVTQTPTDVPSSVLAQLGNRVEHALRAFTPEDADALHKTARTFPTSEFYDVEKLLTSLGIGEAAVTVLSPRGIPTPLAATRLVAPDSSMDPLSDDVFAQMIASGSLAAKYGTTIDRDSAYERITSRLQREAAAQAAPPPPPPPPGPYAQQPYGYPQGQYAGQPGYPQQPGYAPPAGYPGQPGYAPQPGYPRQPGYPQQGQYAPQPKPMTPAQQQAEIRRQARELDQQRRAEERAQREQAAADKRARADKARSDRQKAQIVNSVVRGVFGVLTGRRRW